MTRRHRGQYVLVALAATLMLLSSGCEPVGGVNYYQHREVIAAPARSVSVYQLAGRLGMTVDKADADRAVLSNENNTLLIFRRPTGVYVNGTQIAFNGEVSRGNGTLFVSEPGVEQIRVALRPAATPVEGLRRAAPPREPGPIVVIDAGHGGQDPGTLGNGTIKEKTVNLAIAKKLERLLIQKGVQVIMTRSDDTFVELNERSDISNSAGAAMFISIHADAADTAAASGFTVFIAEEASSADRALGQAIADELATLGITDRGVRQRDLRVLRRTSATAVLVETGFLTNHSEARRLSQESYQGLIAEAICEAVLEQLTWP
jgi:N-acetylmuramoyl-L-alanine amidase